MDITKARINLKEGTIELEGSETFVSKYLDAFKGEISVLISESNKQLEKPQDSPLRKEPEKRDAVKEAKKISPKKVEVEPFEIDGKADTGVPSLESFFKQKGLSGSAQEIIAGVGYYTNHYLSQPEFSEGNVEFACKVLGLSRPIHLHQAFVDTKNKKSWIEQGTTNDKWKIGRVGEIDMEKRQVSIKEGE